MSDVVLGVLSPLLAAFSVAWWYRRLLKDANRRSLADQRRLTERLDYATGLVESRTRAGQALADTLISNEGRCRACGFLVGRQYAGHDLACSVAAALDEWMVQRGVLSQHDAATRAHVRREGVRRPDGSYAWPAGP